MDILDNIQFHMQVIEDSKRTLCCQPSLVSSVQAAIDERDLADVYTVVGSPAVPAGQIVVLDEQAMQASMNQMFQRAAKNIRLR